MPETSVQKFLRSELSFYITLVAGVFSVATMYFSMQISISDLKIRLEYNIQAFSDLSQSTMALNQRVTASEKDIALLQVKIK